MLWPDDFVWQDTLATPETWGKPGLVMFFNLECPSCISRGIPLLKRFYHMHDDKLVYILIHTAIGHKRYSRREVVPTLRHFAESFAKLPFPVALDLDASVARYYKAEGTPHWLLFDAQGKLFRNLYGSQANSQTRLEYALAELLESSPNPNTDSSF